MVIQCLYKDNLKKKIQSLLTSVNSPMKIYFKFSYHNSIYFSDSSNLDDG